MKKLTMICMSTLLLLALSCKKDNEQKPAYEGEGFYATIEPREDGSKTHLNGTAVCWDLSDAFYVYSQTYTSQPACFTLHSIEQNGTTGHFTCDGVSDNFFSPPYTAYYPSDLSAGLTLNSSQNAVYNNGFQKTFASGANPMAAYSTGKYLSFKNVCGLLELKLYSTKANCNIASITIKSKTNENLWGSGAISFQGDTPILGTLSGGDNTLTLNCGNHPLSTNSGSPSYFYFVLPANTLAGGFDITVTDDNGGVYTNSATGDYSIRRSRIRQMANMAVTTEEPPIETPTGAVEGAVFTVNGEGKKVYFAQGNLTYRKSTTKWRFYNSQTDYDPGEYNSDLISLFTYGYGDWSTSASTTDCLNGTMSDATDWGRQVAIENGGNQGVWRTPTEDEFWYVLTQRDGGNSQNGRNKLWNLVQIGNTCGAIIYADNYTGDPIPDKTYISAVPAKCLFLPACGLRYGSSPQGLTNHYTQYRCGVGDQNGCYCITIKYGENDITRGAGQYPKYGAPVRLVQDVP